MENIFFYRGDLPADLQIRDSVAVDTETMGLNLHRDRLCLVQLADVDGNCYLVQIQKGVEPVYLRKLLTDTSVLKIFHFARFDVAAILQYLGVICVPVYCTKIAHKLIRPSSQFHGLKDLCREFLDISLSKEQQISDWGAAELTAEQKKYAALDVFYLHQLKEKIDPILKREGRLDLAQKCFDFIGTRAQLDLLGFTNPDIFEH